jgi:hypothetical protein
MTNIVMLVHGRRALTQQSIDTLLKNTARSAFNLTVIGDDAHPGDYESDTARLWPEDPRSLEWIQVHNSDHNLAKLRNLGVYWSQHRFGRGEYLYLADNDSYFTPGWLDILHSAYEQYKVERFVLIGGQNHHYHQPINHDRWIGGTHKPACVLREYGALAGTSHFMKWATWDKFGPQVETGNSGPCQSEDTEFCERIRATGGRVGAVWPEVVYDAGIKQTGGELSPGANTKTRYPGVVYE